MDTLFINGSPNKNGATVRIAETLLAGKPHGTLHLADKRIYCYGQDFAVVHHCSRQQTDVGRFLNAISVNLIIL